MFTVYKRIILNKMRQTIIKLFDRKLKKQKYYLENGIIKFKILSLKNLKIFFPWNRIFEIGVSFKIKLKIL